MKACLSAAFGGSCQCAFNWKLKALSTRSWAWPVPWELLWIYTFEKFRLWIRKGTKSHVNSQCTRMSDDRIAADHDVTVLDRSACCFFASPLYQWFSTDISLPGLCFNVGVSRTAMIPTHQWVVTKSDNLKTQHETWTWNLKTWRENFTDVTS